MFPVDDPMFKPYPRPYLDDDIHIEKMMSVFEKVIESPAMKRNDSAVVLNVGMHLSRSFRIHSAFAVIDAHIAQAKEHNINIVWRGQNAIKLNCPRNTFWRQFITNSVSVFCKF